METFSLSDEKARENEKQSTAAMRCFSVITTQKMWSELLDSNLADKDLGLPHTIDTKHISSDR